MSQRAALIALSAVVPSKLQKKKPRKAELCGDESCARSSCRSSVTTTLVCDILSVLRTGGVNLRIELLKDSQEDRSNLEEMLMMRTLRDLNLSKLVADDVDLFLSLLHDLFPNQRDPEKRRYDAEEESKRTVIEESLTRETAASSNGGYYPAAVAGTI
jgi:hypothetical protein